MHRGARKHHSPVLTLLLSSYLGNKKYSPHVLVCSDNLHKQACRLFLVRVATVRPHHGAHSLFRQAEGELSCGLKGPQLYNWLEFTYRAGLYIESANNSSTPDCCVQ